jgi:hypothetical protein
MFSLELGIPGAAGELQKGLGARLGKKFVKEGPGSKQADRAALVERTAHDHGKHKDAPLLIWLDRVSYKESGGVHTVQFDLCSKPVGGKLQAAKSYSATLQREGTTPEGMALIKLVSSG